MDFAPLDVEYRGEPFDGSTNFCVWKDEIEDVLLLRRSRYDLKRQWTENEPDSRSLKIEKILDAEDCAVIRSSLTPFLKCFLRSQISEETRPKALMKKIEKHYMSRSSSHISEYYMKVTSLQMKEGSDVRVHLTEFCGILNELSYLAFPISEETRVYLLIETLPQSFERLKFMLHLDIENLTVDDAVNKILNVDSFLKRCKMEGTPFEEKASSSKNRDKSHVRCHRCQRMGHYQSQCSNYSKRRKLE